MERHEVILDVDTHLDACRCSNQRNREAPWNLVGDGRNCGIYQASDLGEFYWSFAPRGVEGTGTYGAGLARVSRDPGIEVLEINRPDRAARRSRGKSDPTDAESAARAVLAEKATAIPKEQPGAAEAMRAVSVARRSAVKAKTQAINLLSVACLAGERAAGHPRTSSEDKGC
ncbi:transposase [Paraburkholderia sediminicola]|uniref:Transposase n=1 Tax=Paraburkholderia rhynchosiae TaxID=487049 RepID=A0ACC7N5P0_9BURK